MKDSEKNKKKTLEENAEKNPLARKILLQKASIQDQKLTNCLDKGQYLKVLQQVDDILTEVEEQLSKYSEGMVSNNRKTK